MAFRNLYKLVWIAIGMVAVSCFAQAQPRAERPELREQRAETQLLLQLLEMDSEELQKLRLAIERIEKMSPEQKQALRSRLVEIDDLPKQRRDRMRERFQNLPPEARERMRERWRTMTPEERMEHRQRIQQRFDRRQEAEIPRPPLKIKE